ncbi:MAG: hydrogenase iron-sulfur subunit, partial [Desulfovibrio sp.]|nr:hydrogenase iron-sulfur subunit [Desulfovibrio sp.]
MSVLDGKELRIVGFLCNWCSYGGADTAGVARATQPTDLRIIRVPCSGRVDPLFVIKALLGGADGVLVSGCHPRDCHYAAGNFYARRRLEVLKQFLPVLGIDDRRFEYTWVSASEGQRWQQVVTLFTERIHKLGPAPQLEDAEPLLRVADMALTALRPLGTGQKAALDELKAAVKAKLPELDCVIGWQQGRDAAHTVPLFMRTPEDVDKLVWGPFNVNNPAVYLPSFKGKKVGIVVKGCDSRSVVELLQENLIKREDVTVFSLPCEGTLDMARVDQELGRYKIIDKVEYDEAGVTVTADGTAHRFCMT